MAMKKEEIKASIEKLLSEVEEEDIGISLLSFYQNQEELCFFAEMDRERVLKILEKLSKDSQRHKTILNEVIVKLETKLHEN